MSRIFLSALWEDIIMANYEIDPSVLKSFLPNGMELDLYNGKAYISLVGFMFKKIRIFRVPIPFFGNFEEVNLRFYVKRTESDHIKRGVVFINETVPYKPVAWLANKLYKEHYISIPTRSSIKDEEAKRKIKYEWEKNGNWNYIVAETSKESEPMANNSIEEFIFEHYYGYTKVDSLNTIEYNVNHPRWRIRKVIDYSIDCDFKAMYGSDFSFLNEQKPNSLIVAEGSAVSIGWQRTYF
jgi:uncharacterized protein YqjF (DUF2071 family)